MTTRVPLAEIARRIDAHLKRFEADPVINAPDPVYRTKPYYCAGAQSGAGAKRVLVYYVTYQGGRRLTRAEAETYLAWLDAGNVGRHWKALGLIK